MTDLERNVVKRLLAEWVQRDVLPEVVDCLRSLVDGHWDLDGTMAELDTVTEKSYVE